MKQNNILKCIITIILILSFLLPSTTVMAAVSSTVNETGSQNPSTQYEDSVFYLANADVQVDDEYYPVTADRLKDEPYLEINNSKKTAKSASNVPGDPMVFYAQRWLNQEYGNVSGFGSITENGKTGWDVVYGLLRALQHELGITDLANSFGNQTSALYNQNILSRNDGVTDRKYAILQFALWCKGYNPGYNISYNEDTGVVTINAVFDEDVENAVIELKEDAGLVNPNGVVTLNVMKALMSMDSFKLLSSSYGSKSEVRSMQQEFNRKYESYIGLIPCDGVYGRSTNKALIYAFQAEEGLPVGVANGVFGPTTRNKAPNIPYVRNSSAVLSYQGNYYTDTEISSFVKLLQFALFVNDFGNGSFTGNFDTTTQNNVKAFQKFYMLEETGKVDLRTWMSLFLSSGDPTRPAKGADCAQPLNAARAKTLFDNGYRYVGRYLTGTYAGGQSKALTIAEEQIILDIGLRFFPIYQNGGTSLDYFSEDKGKSDATAAVEAAVALGIPQDTIIYFAVDFDAMESQVNSNIIPYFRGVHSIISGSIYKTGIYGTRNTCRLVANAGYSCSSFVGDMSTGFSGNLGYKIPDDWAFSQFANLEGDDALGTGEGRVEIDKDAVSGRNQGVSKINAESNSNQDISIHMGNTGNQTVNGPTVQFLDREIPLFELNMEMDIPGSGIYMESSYDAENHTQEILIGRRVLGESYTKTGDREKDGKYQQAYEEVKQAFYALGDNKSEFTRRFNGMKGSLYDNGFNVGFDVDTSLFGFLKFSTETGNVIEGGLGFVGNFDYSASYMLYWPLYLKFEIIGSVSTGLKLKVTDGNTIVPEGELKLMGQLNIGPEINVVIAKAYGGGYGQLTTDIALPFNSFREDFEMELNLGLFFEYDALLWANRWEWSFLEKRLYPPESQEPLSISQNDLNFIEPVSNLRSLLRFNKSSAIFKENVQVYCKPQILDLGNGKKFMTYIDSASNRTDENRTILMYSIYDNDVWSTPQPVLDDGTVDFEPSICSDRNGGVHIVWQNGNTVFGNDVTIEEMAENTDLQYIHWNGTSFNNSSRITNNNSNLEMMHKVVSNGTDISIIWAQNSVNDTFGMSGTNSIHRKTYSSGDWQNIENIANNLNIISSLDTAYNTSSNVIAYTTKTGNDTTTIDDLELFYYSNNTSVQLTNDSVVDHSLSMIGDELYWINGNSLVRITDGDISTLETIVETMDITSNKLKTFRNNNGDISIVWEQTNENENSLYGINYNATTSSYDSVKPLMNDVKNIRGWDGCLLSNGDFETAYCLIGSNNVIDLIQDRIDPFCNISLLNELTYDGEIAADEEIDILADVYNSGSKDVNQLDVNVYDSHNNLLQTSTINCSLSPGTVEQLEIPYILPSSIERTDYQVEILPHGDTDVDTDDNMGTFSFGFADVAISDITELRDENGRHLQVTIVNQGYEAANSINIKLKESESFEDSLDSASKFRLAVGETYVETFDIEDEYLDESYYDTKLYVSVETSSNESNLGNNSETVTIFRDCAVTLEATDGGTVSGSGTFEYDTTATITATANEGYKFYAWAENGYILYGTPETYEITVNEDRKLKALFVLDTESGVTFSGTAYQLLNLNGDTGGIAPNLTVTLDNAYITTTDINGNFTFENVESGAYILTFSGVSVLERSIVIATTNTNNGLGNIAIACFDYVKDGTIDVQDTSAWGQWISTSQGPVANVFADLNGDGYVNARDYAYLIRFRNKTKNEIYSFVE